MNKLDLKEGQEVYVKGRVANTGDHLDIVLSEGSFIENAIILHHEKPVVPQFVADWYKKHKNNLEFSIFDYVYQFDRNEESDLKNWFNDINTNPFQTLVNMHQFGYEVEKEKRYKVVMPNIASSGGVLTRIKHDDSWIWIDTLGTIVEGRTHTRKELEDAGFLWVFDCPGIEVEEVEG